MSLTRSPLSHLGGAAGTDTVTPIYLQELRWGRGEGERKKERESVNSFNTYQYYISCDYF